MRRSKPKTGGRNSKSDHPGDPLAQLHAWVHGAAECVFSDDRGCELANAAVELAETNHPARRVIEEIKTEHRNRLARLCRAAGIAQADLLADTLSLLLEGARVSRQSVGVDGPSAKFIGICEAVIASFQNPNPCVPADGNGPTERVLRRRG